jgi:aerobic carbon-monoxide dehydrogenase medium subunit
MRAAPLLAAAYREVATVRIREVATVGGGLGQGDPAQDPPGAWMALGGTVTLRSASGTREVPAESFWQDLFTTAVQPGEVITGVAAALPAPGTGWSYQKFLPRSADDYAAVSVACLVALEQENNTIASVRLAIGSCAPTPVLCRAAGEALRGQAADAGAFAEAAELVRDAVDPLDDLRGSAAYKRDMAVVFARRALEQAAARARTH